MTYRTPQLPGLIFNSCAEAVEHMDTQKAKLRSYTDEELRRVLDNQYMPPYARAHARYLLAERNGMTPL